MDKVEDSAASAEMPKTSEMPSEMPKASMKKGLGGGPKLAIVGCVLLGACLVALLLGGTAFAFFSNNNIPVFSDVVETVENTVASESMTDEAIQDNINDFVFSMLASSATENGGYTKEEAEALVNNTFEADNFRFDAMVGADMGDSGSLDVSAVGFTKMVDEKNQMDVDLSGTYTVQGADMDFAGELRYKDDTAYLMISELPDVLGQSLGMDAASLTDQWLSMDGSSTTDTFSSLGLDQGLTSSVSGTDMTSDDLTKLQDLIYSDEMAAIIERVDDEVIEGVRTNCFTMTLDATGMQNLAMKGAELWGEDVSDSSIASLGQGGTITLTVCSGRQDGNVYKVEAMMDYDDGTSLSLDLKLWDYDKVDDEVETPSDAVSFEDYLTQLVLQQYGVTQDQQDELNTLLEEYDTSDYENIDWDSLYDY